MWLVFDWEKILKLVSNVILITLLHMGQFSCVFHRLVSEALDIRMCELLMHI